jgi:hypothetical protein
MYSNIAAGLFISLSVSSYCFERTPANQMPRQNDVILTQKAGIKLVQRRQFET